MKQPNKLPEDYFCPVCNVKATHNMVAKLREAGMPSLIVIDTALNILAEAHCPNDLLKQICQWSEKYREQPSGLTQEEQDKLAAIKWKRWAKQ